MGGLACTGILAAERHRTRTGEGQLIRLALSDVAFAMVGNLGRIAEVQVGRPGRRARRQLPLRRVRARLRHQRRPARDGRRAHGPPVDGARARSPRPPRRSRALESVTGHDLSSEDGRFGARDLIAAVLRPWFGARTLDEIRAAFEGTGVSWGPYQTFRQLVEEDPRASEANPMFATLEQPGIGSYLVPASPLELTAAGRLPPRRAPDARASTPRRSSATCSGSAGPRSGGCSTRGRWPGRTRRAGRTRSCRCRPSGPRGPTPGDGAVRAADRRVALVVERVVRQVVLGDVAPHVLVGPVGERVELPQAVLGVPGELGRAGARRRLVAPQARRPRRPGRASARSSGWTLRRSQQASGSRSHSRSPCSAAWRPRLGPW